MGQRTDPTPHQRRHIQITSQHMKDVQHHVIREPQTETTTRYHYTSIRMTQIQNADDTKW